MDYAVASPSDQNVPSTSAGSSAPNSFASASSMHAHHPSTPTKMSYAPPSCASPLRPTSQCDPVQRLRGQCAPGGRAAEWMADQHFVGMPTYHGGSAAPSVVSGMSVVSNQSRMSMGAMSALSISTQLTEAPGMAAQAAAYHQAASTASASENIDPNYMFRLDQMMDQLLQNYNHRDLMTRRKVLGTIHEWSKAGHFRYVNQTKLYDLVCHMLRHVANAAADPEQLHSIFQSLYFLAMCPNGSQILAMAHRSSNGSLIHVLCHRLVPDTPYTSSAILLILCLFRQKEPHGGKYRRCARAEGVIDRMIALLQSNLPDNVKALAVDLVSKLLHRAKSLKEYFARKGGMQLLLTLLRTENEEKILFNACRCLFSLISTDSSRFAEYFVQLEGVQAMCGLLSHGSSRLLHELLKCLSSVGDIPLLRGMDLREPIECVLKLLGAHDPIIASHSTAFLLNLAANQDDKKEAIVEARGCEALLSVLSTRASYYQFQLPTIAQLVEEITENSLITLLTVMRGDPTRLPFIEKAMRTIVQRGGSAELLVNLLSSSSLPSQIKTMQMLCRLITVLPAFLPPFVDVRDETNHATLAQILVRILWNAYENYKGADEKMRLKWRESGEWAVKVLMLCMRGYEPMAAQVASILRNASWNPLSLLPLVTDTCMHVSLLQLLDAVSGLPNQAAAVADWMRGSNGAAILEHAFNHCIPEIAAPARSMMARVPPAPAAEPIYSEIAGDYATDPMAAMWTDQPMM